MLSLAISGFDADPEAVTALLGLQPSHTALKGQPNKSGVPYRSNAWRFEIYPDELDGASHAEAISKLVGLIRGREAAFQRLRTELRPETVTLYGGFYVQADAQAGLWLDASDMKVLADCGIDWGVDIFVEDGPPLAPI